tara:strand:- start:8366 stop:9676 length:1311 start_codon:yes stop_codon:yes gene_type:complete
MKISIVGTGYVGLVSGTCFAEIGHEVTCIDIDEDKIKRLQEGVSPIYEPGLEEMLEKNIAAGRIHFSTDYESTSEAEAIFYAVGTPPGEDGSADLQYLFAAVDATLPKMRDGAILVIKSTVPVGTAVKVRKYVAEKTQKKFFVVNNPEFLKEGAAIQDFMKPDRIVLGAAEKQAGDKIARIYEPFVRQGHPIYQMSNISAEMTKYAANCFLATKISFINEIAKLCDATGADIDEVRQGITSDVRIGKHFLYPSAGYGGSCFPKDVKALIQTAKENASPLRLIEVAEEVNAEQRKFVYHKIARHFDNDLKGKTIAFWGVAFKANTDDIRETAAIYIAKYLMDAGAKVRFYDPEAAENYQAFMQDQGYETQRLQDKYEALKDADALVLLTEWKEFQMPDFSKVKNSLKGSAVFDMRNLYRPEEVREAGLKYFSIGRNH